MKTSKEVVEHADAGMKIFAIIAIACAVCLILTTMLFSHNYGVPLIFGFIMTYCLGNMHACKSIIDYSNEKD